MVLREAGLAVGAVRSELSDRPVGSVLRQAQIRAVPWSGVSSWVGRSWAVVGP